MKTINITRGLFRLWIVGSTLWIIGSIAVGAIAGEMVMSLFFALIPPPIILLIGIALIWAFRGFNPTPTTSIVNSCSPPKDYKTISRWHIFGTLSVFLIYLLYVFIYSQSSSSVGETIGSLLFYCVLLFVLILRGMRPFLVAGIIATFVLMGIIAGEIKNSYDQKKLSSIIAIGSAAHAAQAKVDDEYQKELNRLNLGEVFSPEFLGRSNGLRLAQTTVAAIKSAMERAEAKSAQLRKDLQQEVKKIGLNSQETISFKQSMEDVTKLAFSAGELDRQILQVLQRKLDLLSSHKNQWHVEGKQIIFKDESTLAIYNALLSDLEELKRQEDLLNRTLAKKGAAKTTALAGMTDKLLSQSQ